jgi:hypothetical protein
MRQSMVMAFGVAVLASACGAASQRPETTTVAGVQCEGVDVGQQVAQLYAPGNVERVEPLYRTEVLARAIQPRFVSGARLYVPAQQGMTQGYLERVLSCHAASSSSAHPNDPLHAANVRDVDVEARGQRFVIDIHGEGRSAGKDILERARSLRDGSSNVEVRQLSAGEGKARF